MDLEKKIKAGASLMGSDLYNNLIRYFVNHLKSLREVRSHAYPFLLEVNKDWSFVMCYVQSTESLQDEDLLRYYSIEWLRYTTGANYINRLFTYLNRHWVKRERDEGRKAVYQVYTVS